MHPGGHQESVADHDDTTLNSHREDDTYYDEFNDDSISNGTTRKNRRNMKNRNQHQRLISSGAFSNSAAMAAGPGFGYMQERGGPSARDVLLLKCKDAIEMLHIDLEEERSEKQRLGDDLNEMQRIIDDLYGQDQDKNYRLQKVTEDLLQLQSELVILSKEKDRFLIERDEFDKQLQHFDVLEQDYNQLALEKDDLIDQTRSLQNHTEVLQTEKSQKESHLVLLGRDKEQCQREIAELKEYLQ